MVEFIILYTGYDNRLTEIYTQDDWDSDKEELNELFAKYKPIYLPAISGDEQDPPLIVDVEKAAKVQKLLKHDKHCERIPDGSACFSISPLTVDLCHMLREFRELGYCAGWGMESMELYANDTILCVEFDCESG
jgi:hypothetical protein